MIEISSQMREFVNFAQDAASKNANNTVRTKFHDAISQMFGGADNIPARVLSAMNMKDYEKGKPLTSDRILDVYAAIKDHITGLKAAALESGTLRALDVADTAADKFLDDTLLLRAVVIVAVFIMYH